MSVGAAYIMDNFILLAKFPYTVIPTIRAPSYTLKEYFITPRSSAFHVKVLTENRAEKMATQNIDFK